MLGKFLKTRPPLAATTVPAGRRVYAVGDVHGRLDLLDQLLAAIGADHAALESAEITLIFLGDLVDRGPDSAGVVERVRHLSERGGDVRVLLGNHEEVFLAALDGDLRALKLFCRIGGRETALSYGISPSAYDAMDYEELGRALVGAGAGVALRFPGTGNRRRGHRRLCLRPCGHQPERVRLPSSVAQTCAGSASPFLDHRSRLEKMVVHGHTIVDDVEFRDHRIGIDTGAYASGRLTALVLEDEGRRLISVG